MSRVIDSALLDLASAAAKASPRGRKNQNFHANDNDASHRLLNAIEPGSYVAPHRHLDPTKDESILVLRGKLGAVFFDVDGKITEHVLLQPCGAAVGINVPYGTFHTVIGLESGTVFFESKAGPYVALSQAERASWAPGEGEDAAQEYLGKLVALF